MEYIIYTYKNNVIIAPFDGTNPDYEKERILQENISIPMGHGHLGLAINLYDGSMELVENTWDGYQTYDRDSAIEIRKMMKEFFSYCLLGGVEL